MSSIKQTTFKSLEHFNAVVTGGSRGIGRSAALSLAMLGANVAILSSRSENESKEVVKEIESLGVKSFSILCDVSDPSAINDMIAEVKSQWNSIDILVNNAGIAELARAEEMIKQNKGGSIINVASICASIALKPDHHCHYDASREEL